MEVNENTQLTLDLKTIAIIVGCAVSVATLYFALQKDIEEAKRLPEPIISRTEYDLKDQLIRQTIMDTQKKVDENGNKLDKIEQRLYDIMEK